MTMNKAQQQACYRVYQRSADGAASYLQFRRRARYDGLCDCYMLPWCGMWLGIEDDGYTHS